MDRKMDKLTPENTGKHVMITGAGKAVGLGFNLVLRYLEAGDTVVATVRKPCRELDELQEKYKDRLVILTMDIGSTDSVQAAAKELSGKMDHLDLLINNAVTVSPDCGKPFFETNLDYIAGAMDVAAVGPLRVIQAFFPLLKKSRMVGLIINISSEAGSITKCWRIDNFDYSMSKASLNMATMLLANTIKNDHSVNIFCVHPGWIRTDGREDNPAPLSSYEAAGILQDLFEKRREDFDGHRFITNENEDYPF